MQCRMPGCNRVARGSWKLIHVCYQCLDAIQDEQHKYLSRRISAKDRYLNAQIDKIKAADERKSREVTAVVTKRQHGNYGGALQLEFEGKHYNLARGAAK